MVAFVFDIGFRTNDYTPSTCLISGLNSVITINGTTGGEIRCRDVFHQFRDSDVRIVDKSDRCVDRLREIVRRHIGCHTDSNTRRPIYKQIRKTRR